MPNAQSHSFKVHRRGNTPIFRQIYKRVIEGILGGSLKPGASLPSARTLASELSISRGTVEEAYGMLASEGYIVRRRPNGTLISPDLDIAGLSRSAALTLPAENAETNTCNAPLQTLASSPFRIGVPAFDAFPRKVWARLTTEVARQHQRYDLDYPDPLGYLPLRIAISQYLGLSRGIACDAQQIIITSGYQGALDLTARTLLQPNDAVLFENPGYLHAKQVLEAANTKVIPVPVDQQGLNIEAGQTLAPDASLAVVTPGHQFPTCVPMAVSRRQALLNWANKSKAWIIEDDYDGEFHYRHKPLLALKSLDQSDRVIYAGSFSKTLFPSLRLGYLVIPAPLVERFSQAAQMRYTWQPTFGQMVTSLFMENGHFMRHLSSMRRLYASRREALAEALTMTFGDRLKLMQPDGGMHLVTHLNHGIHDDIIVEHAAEHGMELFAQSMHSHGRQRHNGLLLGFTNIQEDKALHFAQALEKSIGTHLKKLS